MANEELRKAIEAQKAKLSQIDEDLRPSLQAIIDGMEKDLEIAETLADADDKAEKAAKYDRIVANQELEKVLSKLPVPRSAEDFYPDMTEEGRTAMANELAIQASVVTQGADTAASAAADAAVKEVQGMYGAGIEPQEGAGAPQVDPAELARKQQEKAAAAIESGNLDDVSDLMHDQTTKDLETVAARMTPEVQPAFGAAPKE